MIDPLTALHGASKIDQRLADGTGYAHRDGAPDANPPPVFRPVINWAGKPVPERRWHVEPLIPAAQVTMLGGPPGCGKSLLATQLAVATAAGRPWLGRTLGRPGPAFYLSAEDDEAELHRRVAAICEADAIDLAWLDGLYVRSLAGEDALLARLQRGFNQLEPTELYRQIAEEMSVLQPRIVVLDTLADLHAGNEIDRAHARQFITMLRHLAIRYDAALLLLAHPSLTGMSNGTGLSGSTGWEGSVRSRLYLDWINEDGCEADAEMRQLTLKKANYARRGDTIQLRWRLGGFVAHGGRSCLDRKAKEAKAERVFLKLLDAFATEGRQVRPSTGSGYAPSVFFKSGRHEGVSKKELAHAMERLFERGEIRVGEQGPPSRRTKHIERAEP